MRLPPRTAAALTLLGLGVLLLWRVVAGIPSMGGDNAGYLVLARSLLEGEGYRDLYLPGAPLHTKYPPLYPLLLAGWMAAGAVTWLHYILLSAGLVLASALVVLLWAAERRGVAFGFGLALLALLSPAFLGAATEILSEPLFLLLTFVALWAAARTDRADRAAQADWPDQPNQPNQPNRTERTAGAGGDSRSEGARVSGSSPLPESARGPGSTGWLLLAGAAAILAWWTRSAGLPLVLALGLLLLLRRRWGALVPYGAAALLPKVWWAWRGRGASAPDGEGYLSELWMVNPYRPELGTVGPADLAARMAENVARYVGSWIPGGLTGVEGGGAVALGVLLTLLALVGWVLALRRRAGATELFAPLYLGMILVWPEVWASDRFVLPLLPVILLYAGGALGDVLTRYEPRTRSERGTRGRNDAPSDEREGRWRGGRWWSPGRWAGVVVAAAAAFLVLAPAGAAWWERARTVSFCREIVERSGPFGCYGPVVQEYVAAALWSGANLPDEAVVLTRKPRIFYVLSGRRADVFPFSERPEAFLDTARAAEAGYAIADRLDAQASRYLVPVVLARPELFCVLRSFGGDGAGATHLLGVDVPTAAGEGAGESAGEAPADEGVTLEPCADPLEADAGGRPPVLDPRDPRVPMLREGLRGAPRS